MLDETYLKEYHDFEGDDVCLVSFEGNKESIERLRDCAKKINDNEHDMLVQWLKENAESLTGTEGKKDMVSHPSHYCREGALETIWEMVALYGIADTKAFCRLNAHKYRSRAMDKGGEEDMKKSDFYIKFYAYLETMPEHVVYKHLKERCGNFQDVKKNNNK